MSTTVTEIEIVKARAFLRSEAAKHPRAKAAVEDVLADRACLTRLIEIVKAA